jgi:hypothetical protein
MHGYKIHYRSRQTCKMGCRRYLHGFLFYVLSMVRPRYMACSIEPSGWPCRVLLNFMGFFFRVADRTLYLSGRKAIFPFRPIVQVCPIRLFASDTMSYMAIKSTIDLDKLAQWDENGKWLFVQTNITSCLYCFHVMLNPVVVIYVEVESG